MMLGIIPNHTLAATIVTSIAAAGAYAISFTHQPLRKCKTAARGFFDAPGATARVVRNIFRAARHRADYERWGSKDGLEIWWDQRTQQLSQLIPPSSRVIEFGAGRCSLKTMLPENCVYVASDLVSRGEGTLICDLNIRPLPQLHDYASQIAVFSGVLEYLKDVPGVMDWLSRQGIVACIFSYDVMPSNLGRLDRTREQLRRNYYGYMSALTQADVMQIMSECGFSLDVQRPWTTQQIFKFVKAEPCIAL